eukprot:1278851-Ditylum_brightwellii.AAC.1
MQDSLEEAKRKKAEKTKKAAMKSQQAKKAAAALESPLKKTWDNQSCTNWYPKRNNRCPIKSTTH